MAQRVEAQPAAAADAPGDQDGEDGVDGAALVRRIERWAAALGFQQIGIADTDLSAYAPEFRRYLAANLSGDMGYLHRGAEQRLDPATLLPGAVRVISARMNYLGVPPPAPNDLPLNDGSAYVARYAIGRDYHKTVRRRLARLARQIEDAAGGAHRAFTDSAPVLEKPLGEKAGLGWQGKNTLLLNAKAGSWFFLGEIFTTLPLPATKALAEVPPPAEPGCGQCRACISVCPTGAIVGPRRLDATRCISYLTIEHKGAIPPALRPAIGNRVFGCDDCQIVCPWNRYAQRSPEADFAPRHGLDAVGIADLLAWDEATFNQRTLGMAIRRINYQQWLRNLAIAAGNAPRSGAIVAGLKARCGEAEAMAREHITWALARQAGSAQRAQAFR